MIDFFVPLILYERGIEINHILLYLLFNYVIIFLLNYPILLLVKKITFKWSLVLSGLFMTTAYYYLLVPPITFYSMFFISIVSAIGGYLYYAAKHDYALHLLPDHNMADEVGNMMIGIQLGLIPASFIGAILLQHMDKYLLIVTTLFLYLLSIVPLFGIKTKRIKEKIEFKKVFLEFPKRSIWFYVLAQFRVISKTVFPLYVFLRLDTSLEYIGIFDLLVSFAGIFFIYAFARKMDRDKKDYLMLTGILSAFVYLLKLNITDTLLFLVIGLLEGLTDRMYDMAYTRNLYALGKHYHRVSYIGFLEGLFNIVRVIIMLFFLYVIKDFNLFLYISAFMLFITGLTGFDDGKGGY